MPGHYSFNKTFTSGKTKDELESEELGIISGVIHNVIIDFPAGCQYLTHVRIARGVFSIWPRNQGKFYAFDNFQLSIRDSWILEGGESEIVLEGYNEDDTHDHTIRVVLQVTDPVLYFAQLGLLERMDSFIRQQTAILGELD
jgi:hypothetical protein